MSFGASFSFGASGFFSRDEKPFGLDWEAWIVKWANWFYSIPKKCNPGIDKLGGNALLFQRDPNVIFLTGSFGNTQTIDRRLMMHQQALFFPILVKEDSFAEDTDLSTESDLIKRASDGMDNVHRMWIGFDLEYPKPYRIRSPVFDLVFPEDNVYNVTPGPTRSVCDGYWLFIKPLSVGYHCLRFMAEVGIVSDSVIKQERNNQVFEQIWKDIDDKKFKLDILYDLYVI